MPSDQHAPLSGPSALPPGQACMRQALRARAMRAAVACRRGASPTSGAEAPRLPEPAAQVDALHAPLWGPGSILPGFWHQGLGAAPGAESDAQACRRATLPWSAGQFEGLGARLSHPAALPQGLWPRSLEAPGAEDLVRACMRQALRARAARAAAACRRGAPSTAGVEAAMFPQVVAQFEALDMPNQLSPREPAVVAVGSESLPSNEPPAVGQPDALLIDLLEKAACSQQEAKVENLIDSLLPKRKERKDEFDEKPNAGDAALIAKGVNSQCQRTDVHAHEVIRQSLGRKTSPLIRDVRDVEEEFGDASRSRPRAPRFSRPLCHGPGAKSQDPRREQRAVSVDPLPGDT
ncbi:unnamed protein product [Prorocentrum cordatum]|uniref:Uncharacterized protein n=1 Tax=Prorocentrum cordatum TaxID=2364126 RepID=A0ABN9VWR5_9DINO|nr:unnamed protein product [Polarella glacialis]